MLLLISSCQDAGKNEQQKKPDNIDSLNSNNKSFLFLTEWFNKVGVFDYDLEKKKYKPVWWHPRENVVMLIYKPGKLPSYFLTAEKIKSDEKIPSFFGLKLFIISNDLSETKKIDDIGDGVQFTARWNEDDNLELIYTSVDITIASYVNQYIKIYDHYGKLIDSEIKTFDIQKSGFPQLIPPRNTTISPSGKYGISLRSDSLFLKTNDSDSMRFVIHLHQQLNKLKWSDDEKFLFITTLSLDKETNKNINPETSTLFIYSISADSLLAVFGGSGAKNFFSTRDLLIFDDGFNTGSVINIYDLYQKKIIDAIKPKKVCGLQIIPTQLGR